MVLSLFEADFVIRRPADAAARSASPRAETAPRERFTLAPAQRERPRPVERRPEPSREPRATSVEREQRAPERRTTETDRPEPQSDRPTRPEPAARTDATDRTPSRRTPAEERAAGAGRPADTKGAGDNEAASAKTPSGGSQEAVPSDLAALVAAEAAPTSETEEVEEVEVAEEEGGDAPTGSALPLVPVPATVISPVVARHAGAEGDAPDEQPSGPRAAAAGSTGAESANAPAGLPAENAAADFAAILGTQDLDGAHTGIVSAESNAGAAAPASSAAGTSPAQAQQPAAPPVPLGAVPMTIGLRALAGSSRFEIRLDPVDLGRIDVSLDIDKDQGTVTTHLVVERPETLALLQRDAGSLQQALSQAGLDPSEGGINLSLRGESGSGGQGSDGRKPDSREGGPRLADGSELRGPADPAPLRLLRSLSGIDIRI
jgi:flagellar hook-length control protein FliK